jgi:hypothetical protein
MRRNWITVFRLSFGRDRNVELLHHDHWHPPKAGEIRFERDASSPRFVQHSRCSASLNFSAVLMFGASPRHSVRLGGYSEGACEAGC